MIKDFVQKKDSNCFSVSTMAYSLNIKGHKVEVLIENTVFAILDVRSAVLKTNDTLDGFLPDEEKEPPFLFSVQNRKDSADFIWKGKSTLWEKEYRLHCDRLRFTYQVSVKGKGKVDGVRYFSGDGQGSGYEFSEGYIPHVSWYNHEGYTFRPSVDTHRWSVLMVPPMFLYAFRCEGISRRFGLGLVAEKGQHNFHSLDYKTGGQDFNSFFWLETDQSGHTDVNGSWTAPMLVGFSGDDNDEIGIRYSDFYFSSGCAVLKAEEKKPRFWYGPMVCGWIDQIAHATREKANATTYANETVYEKIAENIRKFNLPAKVLIIDDKWQKHYATDEADPEKFPNMRAFVDRRHSEGIHTMLWFKLWDRDGWEEDLCVTTDDGIKRIDPSTPQFIENLDRALYRILSSDEGCYDCDGLKIDFAFENPIGRSVKTYSGKYGVELLYELQEHIYTRAKQIKSYALINCSPCHPYFAHICDQARLHDYDYRNRNCREDLSSRARLFSIAMPGVLLDTDNAGFNTHRDTMRWMLSQHLIGVPDLYTLTPTIPNPIDEDDFSAIANYWNEYSVRMDKKYGIDRIEEEKKNV